MRATSAALHNCGQQGHVFTPPSAGSLVGSHRGYTWRGSVLKLRFIGRGMHLEFYLPTYRTIATSRVVGIRTAA